MEQGKCVKQALEVHGKRSRKRPKRRWLDGTEDVESLNMKSHGMHSSTRLSNLEKNPKRNAVVCFSSIAKSMGQVSYLLLALVFVIC